MVTKRKPVATASGESATSYKYEVAFSFLSKDESVAAEVNDLLQDRLKTFLYSERQKELAGTDGEKSFSDVFGKEARLVVVLYREEWGTTKWTRIEETAIRSRAYNEGYEFTIFIKLDEGTPPKWLPPTQLWFNYQRFGAVGAASVIEQRVKDLGGQTREETVQERAARFERAVQFEARYGIKPYQNLNRYCHKP